MFGLLMLFCACSVQIPPPPPQPTSSTQPVPLPPPPPAQQTIQTGLIGEGTEYASPWTALIGPTPGPSIIVEGGIHGDEIAGVHALDRLLPRLEIQSGRVVVLPRMNRPATDKNTRKLNVDLNMIFPGDSTGPHYEHRLAAELFTWVGEQDVDVVLTLHESHYLHDGTNPKTFGQTIVYGVKPMPEMMTPILEQLNAELADPRHQFWPNYYPIATSSTEQFVDRYDIQGFCAETWRGFELETRIELQEELVLAFLDQLGVVYELKDNSTTGLNTQSP